MRRYLPLVIVASLIFTLFPYAPAAAATDYAAAPPAGWTVTGGNAGLASPANMRDADDATAATMSVADGQGCSAFSGQQRNCLVSTDWVRTSGVMSFTVAAVRIRFQQCIVGCVGSPTPHVVRISVQCRESWVMVEHLLDTTGYNGLSDTGDVELDSPCVIDTSDSNRRIDVLFRINRDSTTQSGTLSIYSLEFLSALGLTMEDYIYGLKVGHPSFAREISWWWRVTWVGTWSVTDSDDDVLDGGLSGGIQAAPEYLRIQCPGACGPDTYTIHVHEDGEDEVTYEIDGEANGYLIAPAGHAVITYQEGCYNATASQCAGEFSGVADSMYVKFSLSNTWPNKSPQEQADGTVSIGRWDRSSPEPCQFVGTPLTTGVLAVPGTYTQGITAWDQAAGFFDDQGRQLLLVRWDSELDPDYYECKTLAVDVADGGVNTVRSTPTDGATPCEFSDLPCQIGRAVRDALASVFGVAEDLWTDALDGLHDAAMEKLPFAYVVLAFDGISTQLAAANAAVTSTADCPGVTLEVPLYYGTSPFSASPTPFPVTVLACAQLEPVMGTTWYQAVRTAVGPALYLLFAWSQFKALQPRPSLNG